MVSCVQQMQNLARCEAELHDPVEAPPPAAVRRNGAFLLGVCCLVLGASFVLTPDPRGHGTHQQLLMPPCVFELLTGLPCAFCGMTTGFALMARGQVQAAFAANVMAPPGFVLTIIIALSSLLAIVRGRALLPALLTSQAAPRAFAMVILALWIVNLVLHLSSS